MAHYVRWRVHGDPLHGGEVLRARTAEARFLSFVEKTDSCWIWTGAQNGDGYGNFKLERQVHRAHRIAYLLFVGEIPSGMVIDHVCHVRHCVNPEHLRPTTYKQNAEHRVGAQRNSQTGVRGVYPRNGRWHAAVRHYGRTIHVGTFDTLAAAEAAVKAKRRELFTHSDADLEIGQLELFGVAS